MLLQNPLLLFYDVGFQLSFVALVGIVYLKPILERWVPQAFFGKHEVLTTVAAEVAVMPIVVVVFGSFSPWGILANPLIAFLVPLTMGLSFLAGVAGFVNVSLSLLFAVPAHILLSYELAIVRLFAGGM
jgi:competence protein ComEC